MRIKMINGVILQSEDEAVNKMRLKHGGIEVKGSSSGGTRKGSKRKPPEEKDVSEEQSGTDEGEKDASEEQNGTGKDKKDPGKEK